MGPWYDAIPSELRAVIHEEINRLPAAYRAVLILCGLEGRSPEWAARELGWPLRRLERRLARAMECLRLRVARRGAEVPEGSWDCGALRDLGAIVPKSLIESTVTAATGEPAPASGSSRPQDGLRNRWQDDPCGPPGASLVLRGCHGRARIAFLRDSCSRAVGGRRAGAGAARDAAARTRSRASCALASSRAACAVEISSSLGLSSISA